MNFIDYLKSFVNKAIYVWGAQGKNLSDMTTEDAIKWIHSRESNAGNAERAIALFRKRIDEGVNPIYAFDCSGLIMYFLQNLEGVFKYDMTAQGLYNKCDYHPSMQEIQTGDLVFKGATERNITHVGVYVGNGKTIEAKGRDYGVVERDLESGGWRYCGHLAELDPFLEQERKHPSFMTVTKPMSKGDEYKAMQTALNAAGFTDYNDAALDEDGKWGNKSKSAFEKMIDYYGKGK